MLVQEYNSFMSANSHKQYTNNKYNNSVDCYNGFIDNDINHEDIEGNDDHYESDLTKLSSTIRNKPLHDSYTLVPQIDWQSSSYFTQGRRLMNRSF